MAPSPPRNHGLVKVLLASGSSGSRGGGELYLLYLGRALVELGHQVSLWASSHPRMDELGELFQPIGPVHRSAYTNLYDRKLRTLSSYCDRRAASRLRHDWAAIPHDIVHINKQNLEDGFELLRAAERSAEPSVCTIHLTQSARYLGARSAWIRDALARSVLNLSSGNYITVLEERARDLARFLGRKHPISAIPNGVPLPAPEALAEKRSAARRSLGLENDEPLFVAVGRLVPQKRPLVFLEIARKIAARVPRARFLWVGDGALAADWDAAARECPAVRRLPWQTDVTPYLAAGDCFIHVAQYEGLPLAILEAMAAGLPCLVTPNLRAELRFLDDSNSLAADEYPESWLADLTDRDALRRQGAAARATVEAGYSFLTMAESCVRLYEAAIRSAS